MEHISTIYIHIVRKVTVAAVNISSFILCGICSNTICSLLCNFLFYVHLCSEGSVVRTSYLIHNSNHAIHEKKFRNVIHLWYTGCHYRVLFFHRATNEAKIARILALK